MGLTYTLQKLYIETINRELGKPTAEDRELYSVLRDDPNDHQKRGYVYIYTHSQVNTAIYMYISKQTACIPVCLPRSG